jgi:hypothetical protein
LLSAASPRREPNANRANDYAQAERFMSYNTAPLVDHAVQKVRLVGRQPLLVSRPRQHGDHFVQMDAVSGKVAPLFDQVKLAAALGKVTGKPVDANKLPVTGYGVKPDGRLDIAVQDKHYLCDLKNAGECVAGKGDVASGRNTGSEPGVLSPDKKSRGLHPPLEPVAARHRQRQGNPAHHRRRGKLRLRHRQRRLEAHRQRDPGVVAGFETDRHVPAGPAQDRRHVSGDHQCRPSEAGRRGSTRWSATRT